MWMAGYAARTHEAEGKYCELWTKVLVLEDPLGSRGVLVSLDLVGVGRGQAESLCQKLEQRYGIERAQVALCSTHTHSGPVVGRNLEPLHYRQLNREQQLAVDQYADSLERRVVDCVGKAMADLQPCTLAWGSGVASFAVNRRENSEAGVVEHRAAGQLVGPMDHDVPVLAVRTPTGQLKAVAFGYACHATVLDDYMWSGDYPGFAELEIQNRYPGCVALFWAGCGAGPEPHAASPAGTGQGVWQAALCRRLRRSGWGHGIDCGVVEHVFSRGAAGFRCVANIGPDPASGKIEQSIRARAGGNAARADGGGREAAADISLRGRCLATRRPDPVRVPGRGSGRGLRPSTQEGTDGEADVGRRLCE